MTTDPPSKAGTHLAITEEFARSQAERWGLVREDGSIICLRGCGREATLPSLCCVACLSLHRRGIVARIGEDG